ncbi:NPCBM/NEW2 domain-containing protein [Spirosoma flavum]|uniref:NPCBM/NEW2 domain-containing protein n=1 Tax=Spirosoma flavum TaxID=2048557 RepID=A0ABW6AJE0_9BACT
MKKYSPHRAVMLMRYGPVCLLLIGGLSTSFGQTTYYVANSGNDSNTGRSSEIPFQTIAKINSLTLQPGDQVLFRRSDTFRGSLQLRQSGSPGKPIVVDAYGSGNKPVLAGSVAISNWVSIGNNTWQATCSTCGDRVTGLYRDNSALPLGRYPNLTATNKGYLTVQSHTGKTQLTSQQALPTNWTGGEAVFRPVTWILNRAKITGKTGNTLTLEGGGNYDISDNWGYFIQNHPATLDQVGEWYYNPANKTIQLYDDQTNPNGKTITATTFSDVVNLSNVSFVSVRNLQLTQARSTGLAITNSSNLVITTNDITQSGEDGILIQGSGNQVLLEGNLIENVNNNGVNIAAYQNVTFRGNTIRNVGLIPGRGKSGDGTYVGFQSACTANTLIENNVLDNIGYNALNFSTSTTIQRNKISNFCLTKSDGSGLYIWNGNQQPLADIHLLSNVVYNAIGAPEGAPSGTYSGANGIYLDDCTTNIEVAGNSVYNCNGYGVYLHGSSNIKLTGNTAYNNSGGQLSITSSNGCQPRNNVIQNNIFVSRLANQFNVKYESNQNDLASYGLFDNNVYARPFEDTYTILAVYNRTIGASLSMAQWKSQYGKDMASTKSPFTYTSGNPDDYIKYIANSTATATLVSLEGTYRDARNKVCTGQITVPAFSSVVLLKDITPVVPLRSADNPATTVAGLDYRCYEGNWSNLPDFNTLIAVKTGVNSTLDLSVRSRESTYALRYTGYINIPTDGTYTFYTTSDDGSKLLIGTTEVVNNDGLHAETEKSGKIGLKAGKHALSILYLQGGGGQTLTASYEGPGISKQAVPASAFYRVPPISTGSGSTSVGNGTGLLGEYFNTTNLTAPAVLTRTDATVNFDWSTNSPAPGTINTDNFSVRWTGQVQIPVTGSYTFSTTSDDGVRLWVNGAMVINDWNAHPTTTNNSTPLTLTAGQRYTIQMEYFDGTAGAMAKLLWAYPGQVQQAVPKSYLYPATPTPPPSSGKVTYLSDLTWTAATNGYGPVEKDRSNGESGTGDGRTLTLNGVTYPKGLGIHAPADITYNLGGKYTIFSTAMGIDDEMSNDGCGTVNFNIYVDNVLVYSSGKMTPASATKSIDLNVSGKQTLRLVVTDGGDGNTCDHADWAGARLTGSGSGRIAALGDEVKSDVIIQIYPVPAHDEVRIRYYAESDGEVAVQLVSMATLPVRQVIHQVVQGENIIKVPVGDLDRGIYVLTLTQGQQRLSRKVLLTE